MRTLIQNGTVVTASETFAADLLIEGERVAALLRSGGPEARDIVAGGARVIDAAGCYLLPGGIDAHTHLDGRDPVLDLLMATHGPARLPSPAPSNRRFHDLAESIAYQQLNGTAAATIWGRVRAAAGEEIVTPQRLLDLGTDPLRAAGLSGSKTRSMLDLSQHVVSGQITLDRIGRLADE